MLFGWEVMIYFHCSWGELQTRFIQSLRLSKGSQVMESSKKNAMPNKSHPVRNHVEAMIRKDLNWYFPSPPTLSMSFSKGVSRKASVSSWCCSTISEVSYPWVIRLLPQDSEGILWFIFSIKPEWEYVLTFVISDTNWERIINFNF